MKTMKYDPEQLCYWLEAPGIFEDVKCSKTLGAARFKYKNLEVFVSASGKVTIRGSGQSKNLFELLTRCLWPAKYCMCSLPAIDCCRGVCNYCGDHVCDAIGGESGIDKEHDFGRNIVKRSEKLKSVLEKTSMLIDRFKEIVDAVSEGSQLENKNFEEQYCEINKNISAHLMSAKRDEDAALGIFIAGVAANVKDSISKVLALSKIGLTQNDVGALTEARNIVVGGFNALITLNSVGAMNIVRSYSNFTGNYNDTRKEILDIAKNGSEIAKLLNRPVPK